MPTPLLSFVLRPSLRPIAVIISLGLVLLSATTTLLLSSSVNRQVVDMTRNFDLRQKVEMVAQLAYNMEISRRGYLLTLDESYLDLYQRSILTVDQTLSELALLSEDNPQQVARVKEISALVHREYEDVNETINLAKQGRVNEAVDIVRGAEGKLLLEKLANTVSQFVSAEESELFKRNNDINRMRSGMAVASIVALLSATMLGILLFSRIQRYARALIEGQTALLSEKELLEQRVRERTAELEQERRIAERERRRVEILLHDSNHRIGNSLATVSSLLGLQLRQTRNEEARRALSAARDRVHTVSTAHRRLRLGEDMESTRVDEFLHTVVEDIRNATGSERKIVFKTDFAPLDLKARDVTTIGIIVGELVTNAIKHAFPGRQEGQIFIAFKIYDNMPALIVEDNGVGCVSTNGEKPEEHNGLGMLVVEQLCLQFGGKPSYMLPEDGIGTRVVVRLSLLGQRMQKEQESLAEELGLETQTI